MGVQPISPTTPTLTGQMTSHSGLTSPADYGFTGEYSSHGLTYLRARHYAPGTGRFLTRDTWMGDYNRPLSLNQWGYVEGNPVNLIDPTGFCAGVLDEKDECWQLLLEIEKQYSFLDLQSEVNSENYWTYDELIIVQDGLERLDRSAAKDLVDLYPFGTSIKRVRKTVSNSDGTIDCGAIYTSAIWMNRPFLIYDNFDKGCVIHELAHIMDVYNLKLAKPFAKYVGAYNFFGYHPGDENPPVYGLGDPPSRYEDFAESLTEYVLLYTNESGPDIGIKPGEKRWYFIEAVLDTGAPPLPSEETSTGCVPDIGLLIATAH